MIPVYKPYFTKESLRYAHEAIDSTWISSHGNYLSLVEEKLKNITKTKYVILTNNGTSATHLVAHALKFKYPHIQNLFVPANSYIASWNMFIINPVYNLIPIDADINTWNIDKSQLYEKENTAILIVHNINSIINVLELKRLFPNTIFIEDNCEGFLGKYEDIFSGNASIAYSVSFFGNKNITSGEGGAFFTNDEEIYEKINKIRSHGFTHKKFIFNGIGYNYRMTNVQAALLYGQLLLLNEIKERKNEVFETYKKELNHPLIEFQKIEDNTEPSNWMFGIRIKNINTKKDKFISYLSYNDIETRPMFPPINYHSHFSYFGNNFPISKELYESVIILPSYCELTKNEIKYISKTIINFLENE